MGWRHLDAGRYRGRESQPETIAVLADGLYLADLAEDPPSEDYSINHACDSNLWMLDAVTLQPGEISLPGEEVTADYACGCMIVNWKLDPAGADRRSAGVRLWC